MGFFPRSPKTKKSFTANEILTHLPGNWAGHGKIYTPAGNQNYLVELKFAIQTAANVQEPNLEGRMVSYLPSGSNLETEVLLKVQNDIWFLTYSQTNVYGQGKLQDGRIEFLQKDPTGRSEGQTAEFWKLLSPDHLFIETYVLGPSGQEEPFLKIVLQKS